MPQVLSPFILTPQFSTFIVELRLLNSLVFELVFGFGGLILISLIQPISFAVSVKMEEHSDVRSFITCVDSCSLVFNASIFLMNESILFPLSNPTIEADSTEFHFALVIVTELSSSCVCCSLFISLQVREKWSPQ